MLRDIRDNALMIDRYHLPVVGVNSHFSQIDGRKPNTVARHHIISLAQSPPRWSPTIAGISALTYVEILLIRYALIATALSLLTPIRRSDAQALSTSILAITHVTAIDSAHSPRRDLTVVIRGSRITVVGPASLVTVPSGAKVIDGHGQYLIPGLWDAHVHLTQVGESVFPLLVASGITSVRDMGSDFKDIKRWRAMRSRGALIPRIISPGPIIDGGTAKSQIDHLVVSSPTEARHVVDSLATLGVDFIKVYGSLTRAEYDAVADEAKRRGLSFAGHTLVGVSPLPFIAAGQRTIEHGGEFPLPCSAHFFAAIRSDTADAGLASQCAPDSARTPIFAAMVDARTWFTPTLASWRGIRLVGDPAFADSLSGVGFASTQLREHWRKESTGWHMDAPTRDLLVAFDSLTGEAYRAGVPLLAGTDLGNPYVVPGASLHDELERLVCAGVSPLDAIRSATLAPAAAVERSDSVGTIESGKVADLVLLGANPLVDIRNTRKIDAVILNGHLLDATALRAMVPHGAPNPPPVAPSCSGIADGPSQGGQSSVRGTGGTQ